MNTTKTSIIVVAMIVCIAGSAGATYFFMDEFKNSEINNLKTDYDDKIDQLLDIMVDFQNIASGLENDVDVLTEGLNDTKNEMSFMKEKWEQTNESLVEKDLEIENLRTGTKYNLHDPTYNEVASFISSDKTDETSFDSDTFDCENYALEVNNNAENKGLRCALVVMYFDGIDTGHAIVGFNTVDRGMIYVEPQTDDWVENFEIGNDYWTDCVVPGNYVYPEDPYDTINEILVYW